MNNPRQISDAEIELATEWALRFLELMLEESENLVKEAIAHRIALRMKGAQITAAAKEE